MATTIRKVMMSVSNTINTYVCITSFLFQLSGLFQQSVQLFFCLQDGRLQLLFAGLVTFGVGSTQAVEFFIQLFDLLVQGDRFFVVALCLSSHL